MSQNSDRVAATTPHPEAVKTLLDEADDAVSFLQSIDWNTDASADAACDVVHALEEAIKAAREPRVAAPTPETPALIKAARLLALSLPDVVLESIRPELGNTNVAVIKHWRDAVTEALAGAVSHPQPEVRKGGS